MKKFLTLIAAVAMVGSVSLTAQEQQTEKAGETTFWVRGNCGSCEKRIEKTLENVEGVEDAEWDWDSGNVTVSFDPAKTNRDTLEKAVAHVGHATKKYKANEKNHDKLPACCREGYKRHQD